MLYFLHVMEIRVDKKAESTAHPKLNGEGAGSKMHNLRNRKKYQPSSQIQIHFKRD